MTVQRFQKIRSSLPATASKDNTWDDDDNEIVTPQESATSLLLEKPMVTKQERLAVECQKPRFRAPCQAFQRRKCVRKKNGDFKIVNCINNGNFDLDDDLDNQECICENGTESRSERQLQKDFLKKHLMTTRQQRRLRHKFLNLEPDFFTHDDDDRAALDHFLDFPSRHKRSADTPPTEQPVTQVLEAIAEEEIDQVDIIMEDISDEISNLEQSIVNSTIHKPSSKDDTEDHDEIAFPCEVSKHSRNVNCSSEIYNTHKTWRSSKNYINEQIRRLRSQLFELKVNLIATKFTRITPYYIDNLSFPLGNSKAP